MRHAAGQGAIAIVAANFASRIKEAATPLISIVVPVFNEEEVLEELYRRLVAALGALGHDIEIVFVDDGSRDRSRDIIRALASRRTRACAVRSSRAISGTRPRFTPVCTRPGATQ